MCINPNDPLASHAALTGIRAILSERPSEEAWAQLIAAVEEIEDADTLHLALDHALVHLEAWPRELRQVPERVVRSAMRGKDLGAWPAWPLCAIASTPDPDVWFPHQVSNALKQIPMEVDVTKGECTVSAFMWSIYFPITRTEGRVQVDISNAPFSRQQSENSAFPSANIPVASILYDAGKDPYRGWSRGCFFNALVALGAREEKLKDIRLKLRLKEDSQPHASDHDLETLRCMSPISYLTIDAPSAITSRIVETFLRARCRIKHLTIRGRPCWQLEESLAALVRQFPDMEITLPDISREEAKKLELIELAHFFAEEPEDIDP